VGRHTDAVRISNINPIRTPDPATTASPIAGFLLLLRLGFFFGLAFEEFHAQGGQARPGSIRSFPSLAHAGGLLYRLVTIASSPTICCR
jgi:hypothetical protein